MAVNNAVNKAIKNFYKQLKIGRLCRAQRRNAFSHMTNNMINFKNRVPLVTIGNFKQHHWREEFT
jgi:hypothetical protein